MKKFNRVLATLSAVAMLGFGWLAGCSDDGDDSGTPFTSQTQAVENTAENLGAVATSVTSADTGVATAEIPSEGDNAGKIVITSRKTGTSAITAKAEGYTDASFLVTVGDTGAITLGTITKFAVAGEPATSTVTLGSGDNAVSITVTTAADGTKTATTTVNGEQVTVTVGTDASGNTTYTVGSDVYAVSEDGNVTKNGEDFGTDETTVIASEATAKGTYSFTMGEAETTIIAVGGKIYNVTAGTDEAEEIGTYTITEAGEVSGTFDGEAFTADTDDQTGRIASITIGDTPIALTWKSGETEFVLHEVVKSVKIGYEENKENIRDFKVGQSYKLHAVVVADEGMGEVEWSAEPADAVDIIDASEDTARAEENSPVTISMKKVTDENGVVITLKSKKDPSKSESITLKIAAATVVEKVEEDATLDWKASDYETVDITETKELGLVTVIATSSKKVTLSAIANEADYEKYGSTQTFTQYLKFNGPGKKTERALKVTTSGATTVKIYAKSGSGTEDRNLIFENASGDTVKKPVLASEVTLVAFEAASVGDYWIYPEKDIRIYAISGLSKVTAVSISGGTTLIGANAELSLTAVVTKIGNPAITYAWEIEGEGATLSATNTEAVTLQANNTDTASQKTVSVKVTVGGVTSEPVAVTIEKAGVLVEDKINSVTIKGSTETTPASGATLAIGDTVTLTADVDATGNPAKTYEWTVTGATPTSTNEETVTFTAANDDDTEKTITVSLKVSDVDAGNTYTYTVPVDTSAYRLGTLTGDEATSGKVYLFESGKEYLTNTRNGWQSKEYTFATLNEGKKSNYNTFDFKASHSATFKVKGVKALSALVYTTKDSSYKITAKKADGSVVLDTETISVTKDGGLQESIIFNTGTTEALTITLAGVGSESMYPIGFRLFDTEQEVITITKTPTVEESLVSATGFTFTASSNMNASETFTWSSSNTEVAEVDSSTGALTNKKAGTTTITATASTGKTATYSLTVNELGLTLSPATATVENGATRQLAETITPSGLTATRTITWASSAENVATVSNTGLVTAKADSGTATITATIEGTAVSATCTITAAAVGSGGNGGSVYTLDAADLEAGEHAAGSENVVIDGTTTILCTKKVTIVAAADTVPAYINLSGGKATTSQNSLKLTISGACTITVTARGANSGGSVTKLTLIPSSGTAINSDLETEAITGSFKDIEIDATSISTGTYYLGGKDYGVQISKLVITYK